MVKLAANLSMLFNEYDFLDRFEKASRAGFKGIEYLFPYQYPKDQIKELLDTHDLIQVLHNLPAGDWDAGERGIACQLDKINEFQNGVGLAIEYAKTLGCTQLNCLSGIPNTEADEEKTFGVFVDNLQFAASELEKNNIKLLIEPINTIDIPGFYLNTVSQAKKVMEAVNSSNLFLQYDIYHTQIMEGDILRKLEANLNIIKHIQIADNPGRHEPGTGEINYSNVFPFIDKLGYTGWIGCEYKPAEETFAGLGWITPYL